MFDSMFDSTARSIDPRFGVNVPRSGGPTTEPALRFRFAITWTSLTTHLELREAAEWTPAVLAEPAQEVNPSSLAAPSDAAVPALIQRPELRSDPGARWEMVVPKMVRADRLAPALASVAPFTDHRNGDDPRPLSIPAFASIGNPRSPLLSRALAMLGRRTRALLAGPAKPETVPFRPRFDTQQLTTASGQANRWQVLQLNAPNSPIPVANHIANSDDLEQRHALRELLLAKITNTLRNHPPSVDSALARAGAAVEDPDKRLPREPVLL